jgi:hypothetical protein
MKLKLLIFFLFLQVSSFCQINLVPNPSFEEWDIRYRPFEDYIFPKQWINPNISSPDYFTTDTNTWLGSVPLNLRGYTYPYDGNGYCFIGVRDDTSANFHLGYKEYVEVELIDSLKQNRYYYVSLYVRWADSTTIAIYDLGVYFSQTLIYDDSILTLTMCVPQIKNDSGNFLTDKVWTKISGYYLAQGGEKFIVIGNFKEDKNTDFIFLRHPDISHYSTTTWGAGYYIDMVSVVECEYPIKEANAGNNKIICIPDSTSIGTFNSQNYEYSWEPQIGLNNPFSGTPNASPAVTTTYTLTQKYYGFLVSTDEVIVTVKDCQEPEGLIVFPNPIVDNITFKLLHGVFTNGKIEIYDVIGKKILTLLPNDINIISAEMSIYASGTYLYRAYSENKMLGTGKFVIQ